MTQEGTSPTSASASRLRLRLYVAGESPNSRRAIMNLKRILVEHFENRFDLEIIDALGNPLKPIHDGILLTPTLIRLDAEPPVSIFGDLSDTEQVLLLLGGTESSR